jgi:hypothetical protein
VKVCLSIAALSTATLLLALAVASPSIARADEPRAWFRGNLYIDSQEAPRGTRIEALIGETVCGETLTARDFNSSATRGATSLFQISVLSEAEIRGCGRDGAQIRFRVDDRFANETASWTAIPTPDPNACVAAVLSGSGDRSACSTPASLSLVVGPPILLLAGDIRGPGLSFPLRGKVEAYVDGRLCGVDELQADWYWIIVKTDQAEPGCAATGREVTLRVNGVEAPQKTDGTPGARGLDITFSSPLPPAAVALEPAKGSPRWPLAVAVAIGIVIVAVALSRRLSV